jgi:RNA polymerase sigma factor (sigma-70 family)
VSRTEGEFELLYRETRPRVLGYVLRRTNSPADAADALAETYSIAWRRNGHVPAGSEALPWLLGVARKVLANQTRADRRRSALAERLQSEIILDARLASHELGDAAGEHAIWRALGRLRPLDREVLTLLSWDDLTREEIAVVLGCSTAQVRVRLHRARQRMTRELALEGLTAEHHLDRKPRTSAHPLKEPS